MAAASEANMPKHARVPEFHLRLLPPGDQQFQPFAFGALAVPPQLRMHEGTVETMQEPLLQTQETRSDKCCNWGDYCCAPLPGLGMTQTQCQSDVACLSDIVCCICRQVEECEKDAQNQ